MKISEIKLAFIAVFAAITGWLGVLAVPVYVMIAFNIIDYLTGLTAAPYRGEARNIIPLAWAWRSCIKTATTTTQANRATLWRVICTCRKSMCLWARR